MPESKDNKAHFSLIPVVAGAGAAGGLFAGWKIFGRKKNAEEVEVNPVVYWTLLALFVAVLIGLGIFAVKKLTK